VTRRFFTIFAGAAFAGECASGILPP
jgi:hypothetical protein